MLQKLEVKNNESGQIACLLSSHFKGSASRPESGFQSGFQTNKTNDLLFLHYVFPDDKSQPQNVTNDIWFKHF